MVADPPKHQEEARREGKGACHGGSLQCSDQSLAQERPCGYPGKEEPVSRIQLAGDIESPDYSGCKDSDCREGDDSCDPDSAPCFWPGLLKEHITGSKFSSAHLRILTFLSIWLPICPITTAVAQ